MTPIEKKLNQGSNKSKKAESSQKKKSQSKMLKEIKIASDELNGEKEKYLFEQENSDDYPSSSDIIQWVKKVSEPNAGNFSSWVMENYGTDLDGSEMANLFAKALKKCVGK